MRGIDWSRAYCRSQVFSRSRCLIDLTTDGPAVFSSLISAIPLAIFAARESDFLRLVGDIGGTNTRLAVFQDDGATLVRQEVFKNKDRASFLDIAREFLVIGGQLQPAPHRIGIGRFCRQFAAARGLGPVVCQRIHGARYHGSAGRLT